MSDSDVNITMARGRPIVMNFIGVYFVHRRNAEKCLRGILLLSFLNNLNLNL